MKILSTAAAFLALSTAALAQAAPSTAPANPLRRPAAATQPAAAAEEPATRAARPARGGKATGNFAERRKRCSGEWRAAKAGNSTGGRKWPQFFSACNTRLKAAGV